MSPKDLVADKTHTLKATESVLEYLCRDVERLGFEGLLHVLCGARRYCADMLAALEEEPDSGPELVMSREGTRSPDKQTED